jgi:hypothetical protein
MEHYIGNKIVISAVTFDYFISVFVAAKQVTCKLSAHPCHWFKFITEFDFSLVREDIHLL